MSWCETIDIIFKMNSKNSSQFTKLKEYMVKRMGIREEERRKKIRNTEREKQDRGDKDRALEGKRQKERKEGKRSEMKMKEGHK